jgi:hypothetical protein
MGNGAHHILAAATFVIDVTTLGEGTIRLAFDGIETVDLAQIEFHG